MVSTEVVVTCGCQPTIHCCLYGSLVHITFVSTTWNLSKISRLNLLANMVWKHGALNTLSLENGTNKMATLCITKNNDLNLCGLWELLTTFQQIWNFLVFSAVFFIVWGTLELVELGQFAHIFLFLGYIWGTEREADLAPKLGCLWLFILVRVLGSGAAPVPLAYTLIRKNAQTL